MFRSIEWNHTLAFNAARILGAILCLQFSVWGQLGSGSITGVVRDTSQGAIPDAAIKIIHTQSGVVTNAVSNETGSYRVNSILPGNYRIEVTATGFSQVVREGITLSTGQTLAADFTLQVGQHSESVLVVAGAELTETQSSSLGAGG